MSTPAEALQQLEAMWVERADMIASYERTLDLLRAEDFKDHPVGGIEVVAAARMAEIEQLRAQKEITEAECLAGLEFATETVKALVEECDALKAAHAATEKRRAAASRAMANYSGHADNWRARAEQLAGLLTECLASKWATSNDWQDRARVALSDTKPRPPIACSSCSTPVAKFIEPGGEWHPCRDCDGSLCEKCCDAKKARPA